MATLHPDSVRLRHHEVSTVAVPCIDFRFYNLNDSTADDADRKAVRAFLGTENVEFVPLAGGSGAFTTLGDLTRGTEFARFSLGVAIDLHHAKKVLLLNHSECGAYKAGGHSFDSAEAERAFHAEELRKAKAQVREWFPGVEIVLGFMTVRGDEVAVIPAE